jgi:hypothetical protein
MFADKIFLEKIYLNKAIIIERMVGEPQYAGRTGVVTLVDDAGQIHGTWGGCALTAGDSFRIIDEKEVR